MSDYDFSDAVDPFAGAVDPFEQPVGLSLGRENKAPESPSVSDLLKAGAMDLLSSKSNERSLEIAERIANPGSINSGDGGALGFSSRSMMEQVKSLSDEGRSSLRDDLGLQIEKTKYLKSEADKVPYSPSTQQFLNDNSENSAWSDFWADPITIVKEIGLRSAPSSLVSMTGGVVAGAAGLGNPLAFSGGMGVASARLEYGNSVMEGLKKEGIDILDADQLIAAQKNPALMKRVKKFATDRAEVIGAFDAVSGGLASKNLGAFVAPGIKRELANLGAQGVSQAALGAAGEAGAQYRTEGEISSPRGVAAEAVGELITAPIDVAAATSNTAREHVKQSNEINSEQELSEIDALAEEFNAANDPFLLEGPEAAPPKPAEEPVFYADTEGEIDTTGESVARARAEQAKRDEEARIAEAAFRQNNPQYAWQQVKNNVGEEQTVLVDNYSGAIHGDTSRLEVSPEQHSTEYEAKIRQMIKQRADEAAEREKALEGKSFDPDKRFEIPSKKDSPDIAPAPTETPEFVSPEPIPDAPTKEQVDLAALNTNMEPTLAQAEAGNYKKGRLKLGGLNIAIENPKGSVRKGVDRDGKAWQNEIKHHYGDISGVKGADGDNMDVFIGDNPASSRVFVIDQIDPKTGEFDEHKVMTGFDSLEDAKAGYLANYDKDWKGLGEISEVDFDTFKQWTKEGDTQKPYAEQSAIIPPKPVAESIEAPQADASEALTNKPSIAIEPLSERAVLIKGVPKEMRSLMNSAGEVKALWRRKEGGWMLPKKRLAKVMPILEQHFAMPSTTKSEGESLPKGGGYESGSPRLDIGVTTTRDSEQGGGSGIELASQGSERERVGVSEGNGTVGSKDIPLAAERKLDGDALVDDLPFSEMTDNDEFTRLKTELKNSVNSGEYDDKSNVAESDKGRARSELEGRREVSEYGDPSENTEKLGNGKPANVEPVEKGGDRGDSSLRSSTEDVGRSRRKSSGGDADYGRKGAGREGALDDGARSTERITTSPEVSSGSSVPVNFHIKDPLAIVGGGQVARFEKNQAAIELSNILRDESRVATTEEQGVLAGYTGWGSFGQELFQGTWENPKPKANWEKRDSWLREHLGQKEWESAQRSITNAHYTDPPTVMAMWSMLARMGFDGGRVLEPSIGIGNFFGMMPPEIKSRSQLAGIELDHLTGGMAKQLYPDANIQIMGYQDSKTPDNFYDLVVGNWPFENTVIADRRYNRLSPMLHDYFFLKALDQVRPGGIVMGITSKGSMDKKDINIRAALAKKAEIVASFRLPSGAFEEYAGTKVVTDIVILKKRDEPIELVANAGWIESVPYMTPSGHEVFINEYYVQHPEHVIGTIDYGHGTTFNRPGMIVKRPDDVKLELDRIVKLVPEGVFSKASRADHIKYVTNHTSEREGALTKNKEGFFVVRGEYLAPAEQIKTYSVKDATKTAEREAQLSDLVEMRKLYGELIDAERSLDKDAEPTRKGLNKAYKGFVKKYGSLSNSFGLKYLKQIDDPFFPSLAALETTHGNKTVPAKILTESTTRGPRSLENPSVSDAYVLARSDSINPSLSVVAKLAKKPKAEVKKELIKSGAVFELPNGDIAPSDIYLSGNVRDKYRQALAAVEGGKGELKRNVAALKAVLPPTIPYFKIEVQMGASWVPTGVYAEYVAHMLNLESANEIEVSYKQGNWSVKFDSALNKRPEANSGFGTREYDFKKLVNAAIRNQTVTIRHKDSNGNFYVATRATKEANEKISNIREKFGEWLWSDPDRRITLETEYNEVRNAYAEPVFDGSFLSFEGMALSLGNGPFDLRSHQANAIWRALVTRKSLNAHEVGTGKTFTMGGIAVESRRYGLAKKPLILAHNANSKSVAAEIQMMYPSSKVLYIDNLSPSTIDIKLRQIANDDWDAVVVPHSLISRFAFKEETLMEMAYEEIANLEAEAREAALEDGVSLTESMLTDDAELKKLRSQTAKELVKMRNRIIESIKKQAQRASKENAVTFEELGVDMVLVDEAHEFKKPPFATRMRMKGLNVQSSDQSIALSFMTRYIRAHNNGANVHLFTGTPITNTLTEIFHMMRYIMQEEMSAADVDQWDGWFGSFAKEVQDVELNAAAEYESVTRLAGFINVPELRRMIGQYMDVVFADDMPEMQPRRTESGKVLSDNSLTGSEREFLINGRTENAKDRPYKQVIIDTADLTPEQELAFQDIQGFAKSWREMDGKTKREVMRKGGNESPIIYEGLATKASFDVRLMDGERLAGKEGAIDDHPDSKASRVVRNVKSIYDSHEKATQVIFTELGINDTAERSEGAVGAKVKRRFKTFSTVKDIVSRLEAEGIPSNQIAVVNGGTSKDKRKAIADAMNRTEIRVVIGSTKALGVGVNMQRNLRAMHHLDAPWMPGDLEQRNGRGHRQGNQWNTVLEYRYLTDRLDGRRWQVLAIKQRFINAFLKSNDEERVIEGDAASDEDNDILKTFSEAAGDPRILIREKLNKKLGRLQSRERLHTQGVADARRQAELLSSNIEVLDSAINKIHADGTQEKVSKLVADNAGKAFAMNIDGRTFIARKDADHAITDIVTNEMREGDGRFDIGSYGGYPLFLSWPKLESKPVLTVKVGDTPLSSRTASVSSLEHTLRNYGSEISGMEAKKAELSKSLERMRKVSKEPFHMADQLRAVETELNELDLDIANNPVPPPAWLRSGAPTDTEVHWNGKQFIVTGHRWNNDGWFVVAKDKKGPVVIPYHEVTDGQAMAIYEPRDFVAPELVSSSISTEADKVEVDTDQEAGIAFSQSKTERKGSDQASIKRIVDKQVLSWPSAPPVIVVQSVTDLPHYIQSAIRERNAVRVNGVRDQQSGNIYLVADNLADGYQAKRVLAHEAVGHYAMEEMLGDEFKKVVDRVQQLKAKDKVIQQLAEEVNGEGSPYIESAEIIAKMAETGVKHPMLVKAYAALRNFLRRLGFGIEFSLADLKGMLVDAALWLRRPTTYTSSAGSSIYSEAAFSQDSSDSRLMNNIDQYGADVAEWIKKAWKKQWTADLRPAWLALLTRRHLADIATGVLPQIKQYVRIAQYMDARRNDLLTEGADIADKWTKFNIKHRAEGRALADLMHDTTIAGVDPSRQYQPIITKEEVEEIRRKNTILIKERSHDGAGGGKTGIRSAAQLREEISAAETKLAQEYNRQAARSDLLKRWNRLSPEAQTIYREVRDLYKARQRQTLEALEARIGRTITDGKSAQALVSMLREEFEQIEVQEPYFPLSRFGDYWVSATKGDERVFQMFESTSEQNAFMEDMKEQGFKVRHGVKLGNLKELDGVSSKFVADIETLLDEKLGNSPKGEQLRDEIYQMYLKTMPDLSMRKHFIHRKKTAGYAADALRAYAHNIFHGSYQLARLEYVDQLQAELSDMEEALTTDSDKLAGDLKAHKLAIGMQNLAESSLRDMLGDFNREIKSEGELSADDEISYRAVKLALKHRNEPKVLEKAYGQLTRTRDAVKQVGKDKVKAGHIYTEMLKRHEWAMNPKGAAWANWASSIGFVWYLGVSPAAAFVNLTQTPAVALPMLGARYGWGASSKALSRTTREYMAGGFGIENKLSGERLKAYQEAVSSGVIDKTLAHDLAAVSQEGATYNPVRHGVMKGVSFLFHHAERMNREVTYMAAYDLARSRGLRHEKAIQVAHDLTWDAHFDYSSGNKARVMQGDIPKVLLMFRQFSLNMTYMLVRSAQQSISKETDPATRKIARKQLTGVLGMHFAFAGAIGLPLFSVFAGIMNAIFDDEDDPYDFEVEMRNYLADTFPKPVADMIAKGVFNAALGVDVHSRTSINDLWLRSSNRELEGRDTVAYWIEQLTGPMGGILLNAGTAYQLNQDGHGLRALESTVPKFVKDMLKGYRYWDEGVNTLRGDPLIEDLPPALAVVQAMGLSPAALNDRYDANNAVKGKERAILGRRQNLMNLYYLAYRGGDKEGMEEVVEKIRRFNRANPKVRIRKVDLIRSLRARRKASARSEHGVMVSKKLRHLKEEGRFAE